MEPTPKPDKHEASSAFWWASRPLLGYRKLLLLTATGAGLAALGFGAGLSMLLPTFTLLTGSDLHAMIAQRVPPGELADWLLRVTPRDPLVAFIAVMAVISVLGTVGSLGRFLHEMSSATVALHASMAWRLRVYRRLIHAPTFFAQKSGASDAIGRLMIDSRVLANGYRVLMSKAVESVFKGVVCLVLAIVLNPVLTLGTMLVVPPMVVVIRKFGKKIRRAARAALHEQGRIIGALNESLTSAAVVKSHNAEGYERRRFRRLNRRLYRQELGARLAKAISSPLVELVSTLVATGVMCVAAYLIFRRGYAAAEFMTILGLLVGAGQSVKPLSNLYNEIQESGAAAIRLREALETPVEPSDEPGTLRLPRHGRSLTFEGVHVRYPGAERDAVEGVTLEIAFGESVAFVGPNGCGKSTLLSLLPRLVEARAGRVMIDGVDVTRARLKSLRTQMGFVPQHGVLFEGTIAENIAYGRSWTKRDRIVAAAQQAHAHEFIDRLPAGYDTVLGEGGAGLSGGQRQRLCIARAILRDPAILILDEATSQIDAESEAKITLALHELRRGRTMLLIAHRLSTVVDCDRIVVMSEGKVLDVGTHAELTQRCAMYQGLVRTQMVG